MFRGESDSSHNDNVDNNLNLFFLRKGTVSGAATSACPQARLTGFVRSGQQSEIQQQHYSVQQQHYSEMSDIWNVETAEDPCAYHLPLSKMRVSDPLPHLCRTRRPQVPQDDNVWERTRDKDRRERNIEPLQLNPSEKEAMHLLQTCITETHRWYATPRSSLTCTHTHTRGRLTWIDEVLIRGTTAFYLAACSDNCLNWQISKMIQHPSELTNIDQHSGELAKALRICLQTWLIDVVSLNHCPTPWWSASAPRNIGRADRAQALGCESVCTWNEFKTTVY